MTSEHIAYFESCREHYVQSLIDNILPFWLQKGLDSQYGGVSTCLDRDGALMDTTKSVWFQGRAAFTFAYAYTAIQPNPQWLEAAKSCLDFMERHCYDTDGHMFFTVTAQGAPIQKRRYVFSECFAAMAFAQYAIASGQQEYAQKAWHQFERIQQMLNTPGFLPPKTLVPAQGHSITMMLINVASVVRQAMAHPALDAQIDASIDRLKRHFMHPEFKALLEMVGPDGSFIDTLAGRTINPGHSIETAWFILAEARHRGWDASLVEMGTTLLDWSWEWGWDTPYGGIINFKDCRHFPSQDYAQDMKFWWPQCEAIIATLYAYLATGNDKYRQWHQQIHEYTFSVFPDPQYPEWYGYLHRDGSVAQNAKGNLFKGPFHIPRMMILAQDLCQQLLSK